MAEKILITGAAGNIAKFLLPRMRKPGRIFRLLDVADISQASAPDIEIMQGSVTSMSTMEQACREIDAVIHLGGYSRENEWQKILDTNIDGTYTVFEAARKQDVKRVIFASSNHAVGYEPASDHTPDHIFPRPDSYYGVSKACGEALGSFYHDRHGMDVVCLRIGACFSRPDNERALSLWLSPDDCARLMEASLSVTKPGFQVVWGVSDNTRNHFSLAAANSIGYFPQDNSEIYAEEILAHSNKSPAPDSHTIGGGAMRR